MRSVLGAGEPVVLGRPQHAAPTRKAQQLQKLEAKWKEDELKAREEWRRKGENIADITLAPRKSDVQVTRFGLAWVPFWRVALPGGGSELRAAYRH